MATMRMTVEVDGETKLEMQRDLRVPILPLSGFMENPPLREIARAFMGEDRHGTPADSATGMKKISKTGDSLTVAVTKEAKEMGLGKGDLVYVTLERVME